MKLFILGHARHGKDTVAEFLRDKFDLTFQSSSLFAAELVVRPYLAERGIVYPNLPACYADRVNHRAAWFDAIVEYNKPLDRLSRAIFDEFDMYVGIRNRNEFLHARELADLSVWVDAFDRVGPESTSSMTILRSDADIIIDNSTSLNDLYDRVYNLFLPLLGVR